MDLRIKRTRAAILRAFITLRAKKPLERITVTELSKEALINKATFYKHYRDIYDLAEQVEYETVEAILNDIPHPEYLITNIRQWNIELIAAVRSRYELLNILFSGSRQSVLEKHLVEKIQDCVREIAPDWLNGLEQRLLLSFLIRGSFHTFLAYPHENPDYVMGLMGDISECLIKNFSADCVTELPE